MQNILSIITSCFSKLERVTFASVLINSLTVQNVICGSVADLLQSYSQTTIFGCVYIYIYIYIHVKIFVVFEGVDNIYIYMYVCIK